MKYYAGAINAALGIDGSEWIDCDDGKEPTHEWIPSQFDFKKGHTPWNKGKTHPEDVIEKIRKKATGRILDESTRQKMSKSHEGRKHTEESKKLISQKQLGKNNHNSQYVWTFIFESGESFTTSSMPTWCKNNGYDKAALMRVCNGKARRHKDIVTVEKVAQGA